MHQTTLRNIVKLCKLLNTTMINEIYQDKREINQRVQEFGPNLKNEHFIIIFWFWSSARPHQWLILLFIFIDCFQ